MSEDDAAAKELFEAKRQYHEAESALAVATARLNRAESVCRSIWTQRMLPQRSMVRRDRTDPEGGIPGRQL